MPDFSAERKLICDIGRRMYDRQFVAGNEGNLSIRIDEDRVLCTPTLISKGFMEPDDLCVVDLNGEQISGKRRRTSEVQLHLEIYRKRDDVRSVVHCHPPHATAFAISREPIPVGVLPEPDILLGEVPIAPYETPGGRPFADTILPFVELSNTIILSNHGTVSYERDCEKAFWLTEVLDSYCRTLILANQLGGISRLTRQQTFELLQLRKDWGFEDPRHAESYSDTDLRDHPLFRKTWQRSGLTQTAFPGPEDGLTD